MNQLKFVRSKSTVRHSPLKNQLLKKVSKPGKLNVSVGKSRQTSQNKDQVHVCTPKEKVQKILNLLQMHQKREYLTFLQTPERNNSIVPLSHEKRNGYESTKNLDYCLGVVRDPKNKKMDEAIQSQMMEESTITEKLDAFQLRLMKLNTPDQTTQDILSPPAVSTPASQFHKDILKQSFKFNNQQQLSQKKNLHQRTKSSKQIYISKENQPEQSVPKSPMSEYEEIFLEINPAFIEQCRQNTIVKKPIPEQTEEEDYTKQSTKSPQNRGQMYSELYTEKSLILISPKVAVKDTEIQTSFLQKEQIQNIKTSGTQCDTANVQCQTKAKKKNLGLFQYQISYLSPQNFKNQQEIDLLSLEDFQSQILYQTQSDFDKDSACALRLNQDEASYHRQKQMINQHIQQQQNDSRSYLLSQKSNIYLSKEQLLDPHDDEQPYYLQAEPKEINIQQKQSIESTQHESFKRNSSLNFSKNKKGVTSSLNSSQCYKEHLNLLLNQTVTSNFRSSPNPYLEQNSNSKCKLPVRSLQSQCKSRKNSIVQRTNKTKARK